MELYYALKKVVELQSEDILKDVKLINILGDFKAYDDIPSSKYILKYMVSEGLMANLLYEYQSQNDVNTLLDSHKTLLSDTYGYKESLADYVMRSIAYALGWISEIPSESKSNDIAINSKAVSAPSIPQIIDDGKHLLFKQFPINGDVNAFIQNLVQSGYCLSEPYNYTYHAASLTGSFAGNNDCTIAVIGTPKTHIACCVMIFMQEHHIWYTLKDQYEKIKNQLKKKYGTPESYEFFSEPYYEGDGSELTALWSDHCTYLSNFSTENGRVGVSMSKEAKVLIIYQDNINCEIQESENASIADDDL